MSKFAIKIEHGDKKNVKISDGFFGEGSRITTSANRCVLFNVLRNKLYLNFNNLNCADFCCGSGIVGFELLSLGVKKCLFVDCDRKKIKNINDAIKKTGFSAETNYCYLPSFSKAEQFDIIFFDPPYQNDFCQQTIDMIFEKKLLKNNGILIVETLHKIDTKNYKILDIKHLKNKAMFYFLSLHNN